VYIQTMTGALHTNRKIVVINVLTHYAYLTLLCIQDMAVFSGTLTLSIVGASTGDPTQLTWGYGVSTEMN